MFDLWQLCHLQVFLPSFLVIFSKVLDLCLILMKSILWDFVVVGFLGEFFCFVFVFLPVLLVSHLRNC